MEKYKYDLEFFLPASKKGVFSERLNLFLKIGLQNCGDYKILVNFLIGNEEIENLENKFSKNVEFNLVRSDSNHPAAKVYNFYSNYENFDNSKWIIRIDDDSITNVKLLMDFLSRLDHENFHYFIAEQTIGDVKLSLDLLNKFKKLEELRNEFFHEIEIGIYSKKTFERVITNNREIIKNRSSISQGWTDQLFCYLCKIENIYPSTISLLTKEAQIQKYFSNEVAHIHHMSYDKNKELVNIFLENLKNNIDIFKDMSFVFIKKEINNNRTTKIIKMLKGGKISSDDPSHDLEINSFWTYDGSNLYFYDNYGNKKVEFKNFDLNNKNYYKGDLEEYFLRQIDIF